MAGYLSLMMGTALLACFGYFVTSSFKQGHLERNSALGIRTKNTMQSDEAWNIGHKVALPYIQASYICGMCALAFDLLFLLMNFRGEDTFTDFVIVVPILGLIVQVIILFYAAFIANKEANFEE